MEVGARLLDICMERQELESRLTKVRKEEEAQQRAAAWPGMQEKNGTFWKRRNCYSCPQGEADYWWVYRRIDRILETGQVFYTDFQIDTYGHLNVKCATSDWTYEKMDDWERIGKVEWNKAAKKARGLVAML